jgi:hypothetical protein
MTFPVNDASRIGAWSTGQWRYFQPLFKNGETMFDFIFDAITTLFKWSFIVAWLFMVSLIVIVIGYHLFNFIALGFGHV